MNTKKLYYYWFYKYYSFLEKYEQTRWLSETKAMIIINTLEILFIGSLYCYINLIMIRRMISFSINSPVIMIPLIIIIGINAFVFNDDKWKKYIKEFEEFDTINNNKGTWIIAILTVVIVLNFFLSASLLRQMYGWEV